VKCPIFEECIDSDLKTEITLETLNNDLNSLSDILYYFGELYAKFLLANPFNIIQSFRLYSLNSFKVLIFTNTIKRQNDLIGYLIRLKFEKMFTGKETEINEDIREIVERDYENATAEDVFLDIYNDERLRELINAENEDVGQHLKWIEKGLECERIWMQSTTIPGICGIGIIIKHFKTHFERCISNVQKLEYENDLPAMLELFQYVFNNKK
jgi:hypothetical protein